MTGKTNTNRRLRRKFKSKSNQRKTSALQKPSGMIGPRVKHVGGDKFAIVCVDPAKHRSEWMMADYFGNLLIEQQTLEHQAAFFKMAVMQIREAQKQHDIQDMIVVVERTGNYYLAPKRVFAKAGFDTRVVHPFATKQYRMPANPGNKTDGTDLNAQHRVAVDTVGSGEGELVIITQGSSARLTPETKNLPVDTVIVGIVDSVHLENTCVYDKEGEAT